MKRMSTHAALRRLTAVFAIATLTLAALVAAGCTPNPALENTTPEATQPEAATPEQTAPTAEDVTELKVEDLVVGQGAEAVAGKTVVVHYTGWLTDGTQFDSSVGGDPFAFALGAGEVIPGWDEGVQGMKVGGKRKLTIPPDMGYGDQGAGGVIPPGATLVFEVELLEVQ